MGLSYSAYKMSNSTYFSNFFALRLCENLMEKNMAAGLKMGLETTVATIDLGIIAFFGSLLLTNATIAKSKEPGSGMILMVGTLAGTALALKYGVPVISLVSCARTYRAWTQNTLTIPTSPLFHMFYRKY
jgi:hypothetical protein